MTLNQENDDLDRIMAEAEKAQPLTYKPFIWSVDALRAHPFPAETWLVDRLIGENTITVLSGSPASNKTWITLEIARAIASGNPFLNHFPTLKGSVLIVNEEDNARYLKTRLDLLGISGESINIISQSNFKLEDPNCRAYLLKLITESGYKLIIFDSFRRINKLDENDSRNSRMIFEYLQEFTKAGTSVLITHHHRKEGPASSLSDPAQSMRGSSDILAAVDGHIAVSLNHEDQNEIILRQTKIKIDEALPPFCIRKVLEPHTSIHFEYAGEATSKPPQVEKARKIITTLLSKRTEATRDELYKEATKSESIGSTNFHKALQTLESDGTITSKKNASDKKTKLYELTPESIEL